MKPIAITCGDPAGIGPEVVEHHLRLEPAWAERVVLIGPQAWLDAPAFSSAQKIPVGSASFTMNPGHPSLEGASIACEALERAAEGCKAGTFSAVVTGPVSKSWMQQVGFTFPGQTEFFAARWGGVPTMAFAGERMVLTLGTWHIPLAEVPAAITKAVIERTVRHTGWLLKHLGKADPVIGVCGLNPHAGEEGILGREEIETINPCLEVLRNQYPALSDCQPADTLFHRHLQGDFDAVIAWYHDQGLAPLKALEFDTAVNITLGLPYVRTSPDHGTAFSIAGTAQACLKQ